MSKRFFKFGLAMLAPPDLGPAQEEPLIARQPVDHRGLLAVEREAIGVVGDGQPRKVADILAQREAAVDLEAGEGLEPVELRGQGVAALVELGPIGRGPPLVEIAGAVPLRALIVESVPGLVADHRADAPVIHGIVGGQVEEGRLQDRGREDDLVLARIVVGVDRLRGHVPLVAIDRLAELGQVAVPLVDRVPLDVAHQVAAADLQGR